MKKYAYLFLLLMGLTTFACDKEEEDKPTTGIVNLSATLDGKQQVPANNSPGTGTFTGTYDKSTRVITYNIVFSNMTAAPSAGHFHQGAPGVTGPVSVPFPGLTSPINGTATLSQADGAKLLGGEFYANLHSPNFPNGELRGDIKVK
ncbi:CHRD domain-containing protein [Hymenobacter guriensis]|uniref:CHRD domain-containing protein n=1 Tax=Hymenobacter guriensis TaxID=2793065 RepID=A0ABS0KZV9_9BACT|nr:CHRD domain-containing protein [Hymenobacter guriensis]MBG8552883.1 CHRD domain-containing protein [Hymenobacter guriensis]